MSLQYKPETKCWNLLSHALTDWKMCIKIKGQNYADLLLYQKIYLLWICSSKSVKSMKQIFKYWNVYTACSSNKIISLTGQMSNFLFHGAKNESLQGRVSFSIICRYSECTDSILERFFSNISRYSKDIKIKGTGWRWPLTNNYWTPSVFNQNLIVTPLYICHCNTNMQ